MLSVGQCVLHKKTNEVGVVVAVNQSDNKVQVKKRNGQLFYFQSYSNFQKWCPTAQVSSITHQHRKLQPPRLETFTVNTGKFATKQSIHLVEPVPDLEPLNLFSVPDGSKYTACVNFVQKPIEYPTNSRRTLELSELPCAIPPVLNTAQNRENLTKEAIHEPVSTCPPSYYVSKEELDHQQALRDMLPDEIPLAYQHLLSKTMLQMETSSRKKSRLIREKKEAQLREDALYKTIYTTVQKKIWGPNSKRGIEEGEFEVDYVKKRARVLR